MELGTTRPRRMRSPHAPACGLRPTCWRWLLDDSNCGHTEAQVVVPDVRREPEAVRRAAEPGDAAPAIYLANGVHSLNYQITTLGKDYQFPGRRIEGASGHKVSCCWNEVVFGHQHDRRTGGDVLRQKQQGGRREGTGSSQGRRRAGTRAVSGGTPALLRISARLRGKATG